LVIQGSFPGGRPHSTVLLNNRSDYISLAESAHTVQALMRHPNNSIIQLKMNDFQRENFTSQSFPVSNNNVKAYPLNIARLNFQNKGYPLEDEVLQMYEDFFETDLSNVMVHEGDGEAETIGALAFTTGNDIYFAVGRYDPFTPEGQRLLGHELTHVIQQKEGRVNNPYRNSIVVVHNPGLEAEAERCGQKIFSIYSASTGEAKNETSATLQLKNNKKKKNNQNKIKKPYKTRSRSKKNEAFSSKILESNILPEGKKRQRWAVNIFGVGTNEPVGLGGYSSSYTGIPTTSAKQTFSKDIKTKINKLGKTYGCHKCGNKNLDKYIPDHQPPISLSNKHNYKGHLYPHCPHCSHKQGGTLSAIAKKK
jgi:hypothetical protein